MSENYETKYCQHCGEKIRKEAVICPHCGCEVENRRREKDEKVIINNNISNRVNAHGGGCKNKWIALLLCFFLGFLGAHKFYEGKILLGIVYIFTVGFLGIGIIFDFFSLLFKPNPYWV